MAAKLGTIFVEMGLDTTQFTKAQVDILNSSTKTALESEKNFRTLGTQSDLIFNTMKQNIQSSLGAIVNSSKSSQDEITRAQQAAATKISDINKQQFGEHTSFLDKAKENWVAFSVAAVAAWALVGKAISYMDAGAKALQIESSFEIMANAADVNGAAMVASMKEATRSTIDDSDLMQKAVKLMLAGYNPEQIVKFSELAVTASQYAGVGVGEAFDRMNDAIANRTPKALVQLGAITKDQMKVVTQAVADGADSMSLYELAVANLTVKQMQLQGTQDEATISLQRFHAEVSEAHETIGKGLIIGLQMLWAGFQNLGVISLTASAAIWKVMEAEKSLAAMSTWGDRSIEYKAEAAGYKAMAESDMAMAVKLRQQAIDNFAGNSKDTKTYTNEEIAAAQGSAAAKLASIQQVSINKKAADDAARKAAQDAEKEEKEILKSLTAANKESYDLAIANANQWLAVQRNNGAYEADLIDEYYDKKNDAIYTSYNNEWGYINDHVKRESEKQAQLTALNAKTTKEEAANLLENTKLHIDAANKTIEVEASLYKTINQYSDASVAAESAALDKKYKVQGQSTKNELLLLAARGQEENDALAKRDQAILAFYQKTGIYGTDANDKIIALAWNEYDAVFAATKNEEVAKKAFQDFAITSQQTMVDATKKSSLEKLVAAQTLYKDLQGYEGQYYAASKKLIEEKAVNELFLLNKGLTDYQAIEANKILVATVTAQRMKQLDIEKGKSSNDLFAGMRAGIDEIQLKQTTWGQVGYDTFKAMSSGMATTFSTVFEDVYKGKLQGIGDYATMIWDRMRQAFFNAVAKMATEKILVSLSAAWTDSGKETLGIVNQLLNFAGKGLDLVGEYFVNFAQGGQVPGQAMYGGNHPGNDTVMARLSPGEFVVPRTGVNSDTQAILEYIRTFGKAPGYAQGGYVNTTDQYIADTGDQINYSGFGPSGNGMMLNPNYVNTTDQYLDTPYVDPIFGSYGAPILNPNYGNVLPGSGWSYGQNLMSDGSGQPDPRLVPVFGGWSGENISAVDALNQLKSLAAPSGMYRVDWTATPGINRSGNPGDYYNLYDYNKDTGNLAPRDRYDNSMPDQAGGGVFGWFSDRFADIQSAYSQIDPMGKNVLGSPTAQQIATSETTEMIFKAAWIAIMSYVTSGIASGLVAAAGGAAVATGAGAAGSAAGGSAVTGITTGTTTASMVAAGFSEATIAAVVAESGLTEASLMNSVIAYASNTVGNITMGDVAQFAAKQLISGSVKSLMGGIGSGSGGAGGSLSLGMEGMDAGNIPSILGNYFNNPLYRRSSFSARNGLDYVPRDNFLVNTHEGEAVITKEENKGRQGKKAGAKNELHFHFPSAIVVDKKAVNELANLIYPRLDKLRAWGH